jgi:hypothetical protein
MPLGLMKIDNLERVFTSILLHESEREYKGICLNDSESNFFCRTTA